MQRNTTLSACSRALFFSKPAADRRVLDTEHRHDLAQAIALLAVGAGDSLLTLAPKQQLEQDLDRLALGT